MSRRALTWAAAALLLGTACSEKTGPAQPGPSASASAAVVASAAEPTASAAVAASASAAGSSSAGAAAGPAPKVTSFEADKVDEAPGGFDLVKTGGGKKGKWIVRKDPNGTNVLAQLEADPVDTRLLAAVTGEPARDVRASVRCKPISGKVERACGLVFRFADEGNYYVARASAVDKDVLLFVVKGGKRTKIGGWKGAVFGDAWHDLAAQAKGDHLEVFWDGTRIFEIDDKTISAAGKVGVWTRADSVTWFDDLSVAVLAP